MTETSIVRVEPTVAGCEGQYVRRQSISACLLVVAVSVGLYGTLRPGYAGFAASIVAIIAAAGSFVLWVAAMAALLRRPTTWPLYRLRERFRRPTLPPPFAAASVVGVVGGVVYLVVVLSLR